MARTKTFTAEQSIRVQKALEALLPQYESQNALAHALGVSSQSVSGALRGRGVGLPFALPLARLLGVSIDALLGLQKSAPVQHWLTAAIEAEFDIRMHSRKDADAVLDLLPRLPDLRHGNAREAARQWLTTAAEYRLRKRKLTVVGLLLASSGLVVD